MKYSISGSTEEFGVDQWNQVGANPACLLIQPPHFLFMIHKGVRDAQTGLLLESPPALQTRSLEALRRLLPLLCSFPATMGPSSFLAVAVYICSLNFFSFLSPSPGHRAAPPLKSSSLKGYTKHLPSICASGHRSKMSWT